MLASTVRTGRVVMKIRHTADGCNPGMPGISGGVALRPCRRACFHPLLRAALRLRYACTDRCQGRSQIPGQVVSRLRDRCVAGQSQNPGSRPTRDRTCRAADTSGTACGLLQYQMLTAGFACCLQTLSCNPIVPLRRRYCTDGERLFCMMRRRATWTGAGPVAGYGVA